MMKMLRNMVLGFFAWILAWGNVSLVVAQERFDDPLFVCKDKFVMSAGMGIPFIGISEIAYGISDKFTLGALTGITPRNSLGIGIRPRVVLLQSGDNFRLHLRSMLNYYPPTEEGFDNCPWILAHPIVSAEWSFPSGLRMNTGGGMVLAACTNSILHKLRFHQGGEDHNGFMDGTWNTLHVGASYPIGKHILLQSEAGPLLKGFRPDWISGTPVFFNLGISSQL